MHKIEGELCHPNLSFDCTTGTVLNSKTPIDLDLQGDETLLNKIAGWNGQKVIVTGKMKEICGVEKKRCILEVERIEKT